MPSCENLNESQCTDQQDRRLQQRQRTKKENIECSDVDDDRAEDQEAEIPRLRNGDTDSAEDFEGFNKREKPSQEHSSHEHCRRRALGRLGNVDKFQKEIQPENDEDEAENSGGEVVGVFHFFVDWSVYWKSKRRASVGCDAMRVNVPDSVAEAPSPDSSVRELNSAAPVAIWSQRAWPAANAWQTLWPG